MNRRPSLTLSASLLFITTAACHLQVSESLVITGGQSNGFACLWKNGQRIDLEAAPSCTSSIIFAMTERAGTVYSGGYQLFTNYRPCYWKNEQSVPLPCPEPTGRVMGLCSRGSEVICGGFYGANEFPCLWIDNRLTALPPFGGGGEVLAVCADDTNIYSAGARNTGGYAIPCFWINAANPVDLPQTQTESGFGHSIQKAGNTLYIGGVDGGLPCYWTVNAGDSAPVPAGPFIFNPYGGFQAKVVSIHVSGGRVYAAGWCSLIPGTMRPCYWIGAGTDPILLPVPPTVLDVNNEATSITVKYGKTYISGKYNPPGAQRPCYWVDGVRIDLPAGPGISLATGVLVE